MWLYRNEHNICGNIYGNILERLTGARQAALELLAEALDDEDRYDICLS